MDIEYQSPRKGWTVTPDFNEETGEYLDPSVNYGHSASSPFADDKQESPEDYISPDAVESPDVDDEIADAIHDLYDIDSILDYVVNNYPEDYYADYDKAVDEGDWSKVHEFLERMNAEYQETQPQQPEINYEEVTQELDQLVENEPEGTEVAFEYLQLAEQASSPIESDFYQTSASFHRGEISAQDAIQSMLDKYPLQDLITIYNQQNQ